MPQYGFHFDMTACTGCKTCQIAGKDKNDLGPGLFCRRVGCFEGGKYPRPWHYYLSLSCNHCAAPRCVAACAGGALSKDAATGAVLYDPSRCTGCQACVSSCPYGAVQFDTAECRIVKCDMCHDLISAGQEPACTSTCPMRALHFGPLDELRQRYGDARDARGLPDSSLTRPSLLLTIDRHARPELIG